MKRRFAQLAALLLCLTLPLSAAAEFAFVQLGANAYAEPDASSQVVSAYAAGTWVEVAQGDAEAEDDEYVSVVGPDGLGGYMAKTDVMILSQTPPEAVAVVANNGKYVNLRAQASKKARVLAKVNSGTPMTLVEAGKSFDQLRLGGLEGYMVAGMVKTGLAPIYAPVVKSPNQKNVNLRSEPTMNGDILASIRYGEQVSVYMHGSGWAYVRYKNTDGYVMTKFLASAKDDPDPKPVPNPVPNPDPDSDFWETGGTRYVSNGGASVRYRSGPGGSAKVLGKLRSGDEVYEVSTNGSWSKILVGAGGSAVYMMSQYLVTIMPVDDDDPIVDVGGDPVIDVDDDPVSYDDPTDDGSFGE